MKKDGILQDQEFEIRMKTAVDLITRLYHVGITELHTRPDAEAFCQRHRLHRIQMYLDEKTLNIARDTLTGTLFFDISDVFLLHFILFSVRGIPYILGPFCPLHLTATGASAVIRQYGLDNLTADQLLAYCAGYPSISELQAQNIVTALIHAVYPQEPDKVLRQIAAHSDALADEREEAMMRANHNTLIERRYASEREMIRLIQQGDARAAIHHLHIVEQDVSYIKRANNTLEKEKMGAAILRTTVRHAAIEAGLPALVIDRITSLNAGEVSAAWDEQTVLLAKEHLIRNMCKAVREAKEKQYSALVQNTLYYLEHEYKNEISIDSLAAEFSVSTDHLISSFKKEMGITPNAYLGRVRMKKAADLLVNGGMTIGDVSAAVGINDPNYFVKLFKKEFGETPTAFRKRHTI